VTVTLDDIRARARASKSQLFHYFPEGREQLMIAVARYEADLVLSDQQPQLGNLTSYGGGDPRRGPGRRRDGRRQGAGHALAVPP